MNETRNREQWLAEAVELLMQVGRFVETDVFDVSDHEAYTAWLANRRKVFEGLDATDPRQSIAKGQGI